MRQEVLVIAQRRRDGTFPGLHKVIHYVTQEGQPFGSVSRRCAMCGAMCWPGMAGSASVWTDEFKVWNRDAENCRKIGVERKDSNG
jgi:hypothetical protein